MRLIDADALYIDYLRPTTTTGVTCQGYVSQIQINNAPTIEPKRIRGKWIKASEHECISTSSYVFRCSECGETFVGAWSFCPNCGAWMGGQDD